MSTEIYKLWGKKKAYSNKLYWLPLLTHLKDTQATIKYLYENYLSQNQRNIVNLPSSLIGTLGFLHDFGKITPAFQLKQSKPYNAALDQAVLAKLSNLSLPSQSPLADKSPHNVSGAYLLRSTCFAGIVASHHGTTPTKRKLLLQQVFKSNYGDSTWTNLRQEFLAIAVKDLTLKEKDMLYHASLSQDQQILLLGLVMMADWLASNENYFPLIPITQLYQDIDEKKRIKIGLSRWSKETKWQPQTDFDINTYFQDHFTFKPHALQKEMLETIKTIKKPGLILIEAPMGTGKTETALTASEILSAKCHTNGIFYGLPTQATSNAMFSRLALWLKAEQGKHGLKLMHSKANSVKAYQDLDKNSNVFINRWYNHKLGSLEHFTIGTIDQLLQMSLSQRHLAFKHLAFSGKTVIIDEVHTYDAYMQSYLQKTLKWLGEYHVPVIALSATLTHKIRQSLVSSYLQRDVELPTNLAYPLLTYTENSIVKQRSDFAKSQSKKVIIKSFTKDEPQQIAQKADNLIAQGGICGIIVNSIARAQDIAKNVKAPKILLHSSFLAQDRSNIEERILKTIENRPKKLVIIGTQVLEQSLDLDFDALITDAAPMDLLLQRIGRLWRRDRKRANSFTKPVCYVDTNSKSKAYQTDCFLYSNYLINHTIKLLPNEIVLPTDIPSLIEKAYKLDDSQDAQELSLERKKECQKSLDFQVHDPRGKNLFDWQSQAIPNDENVALACVRDIKPQLEVALDVDGKLNKDNINTYLIKLPLKITGTLQNTYEALYNKDLQAPVVKIGDIINGYKIEYDKRYGLTYAKML